MKNWFIRYEESFVLGFIIAVVMIVFNLTGVI